ncbi:MAG TPA: energy transducer TonB [Steroidobacteraceae bacterium]|nr:energy transducer TonB [Steroidobacteraceae bacterium]
MATPASNAPRPADTGGSATGSSRPTVDVIAVTTRDDFLLELGESLGGQASVRPVDSVGAAFEHLTNAKRGHVLVLDTRDLSDLRADIDRVHAQAAHAVVLVFAAADSERSVGAAVKGSNVLAVLPIPLDQRKTSAVLEGALADATARKSSRGNERPGSERPGAAGASASQGARSSERSGTFNIEPFQPVSDSGSGASGGQAGKKPLFVWAGAAAAVVALAVGGYFVFGRGHQPSPAPIAAPKAAAKATPAAAPAPSDDAALAPAPAVETALIHGKVDDLLEKGRQAMRERRYSEPVGDNALLYYRSAAAADPSNGEAADGLQRVAGVLASRFEDAITANRYDEAGQALANLKAATPSDNRVPGMELRLYTAEIGKALGEGNPDKAAALVRQAQQSPAVPADQIARWRADIARHQEDAKVQRLVGLISDRIRDGRLVEPADDSARMYLQQLHDVAPANAATQRLTRDLNSAYLRKAREAAVANHAPEMDRWLNEARVGGVSAADLSAYQRELATARQKAAAAESDHVAQLARDRIRDGRLSDPAQDSAVYYLGQLQGTDPANAAVAAISRDLAARFIDRARAAAASGKSPQIDADLAQARRLGADPKDILAVQQLASAPAAAAPKSGGAGTASLAGSLKRTRYVSPEYPSKALSAGIAGSVTVEYTVDVKGDTRDIRAIDSSPAGVFDRAAISAIKHWHYDPVVVNGAPVEVPVRTVIRFELPK